MTAPAIRYPAGEVTPHGWWHIVNGTRPTMRLRAYDGSIDFYLMGGLAPPFNDPTEPEAVALTELTGLIPPWQHIDQKGATEDGVTHIDALLDPIEVSMTVECIGRDNKHMRRVYRDLIASIDAIQKSELSFLDNDLGFWWAPVRWFKGAPTNKLANLQTCRQKIPLRLRADRGCWQSYPDVSSFGFIYDSMTATTFDEELTGWPQYRYEGAGGGGPVGTGDDIAWNEQGTQAAGVVLGPYAGFDTDTDNQVVSTVLGSLPEITFVGGAFNDVWARMNRNPDGSWAGDGVRGRVGMQGIFGWVELAGYKNFTKIWSWDRPLFIPPLFGEKFTLVAGVEGDPRMYRIQRNGIPVLSHKETGTDMTVIDEDHRGIGGGMAAGESLLFGQRRPASIRKISAGDNSTVSQSGFLACTNIGDQKCYYDYTLFGPGVFRIYDGPGTDEFVEFGPLLPNQVVYLRTDPRSHATLVKDLTTVPPTPQELNVFQQALKSFESFAFANNVPPLMRVIESIFGIQPPQGNLYRYLKGRFSDRAAIPPKSPGNPAKTYHVKVAIDDGNANSKIIASGTPLRRYPL